MKNNDHSAGNQSQPTLLQTTNHMNSTERCRKNYVDVEV